MKKILIIEDEEHIAEAEKLILQDKFKVLVAKNGTNGLAMAVKMRPDIIVLDIMLPHMSGYEICQKLRDEKSLSNTKIIMATAKTQEADERLGLNMGADEYIKKPFEPEELLEVIDKVLKKG